jgi:hypothetical protein
MPSWLPRPNSHLLYGGKRAYDGMSKAKGIAKAFKSVLDTDARRPTWSP